MITQDLIRLRTERAMASHDQDTHLRECILEAYRKGYVDGITDFARALRADEPS